MKSVLVIDDISDLRNSIKEILTPMNLSIDEASNGRHGLDMISSRDYDLVITDILMPDLDGTEVLKAISDGNHETRLLAMSGGGKYISCDFALDVAGFFADAIVQKPFDDRDFYDLVKQLLNSDYDRTFLRIGSQQGKHAVNRKR